MFFWAFIDKNCFVYGKWNFMLYKEYVFFYVFYVVFNGEQLCNYVANDKQ